LEAGNNEDDYYNNLWIGLRTNFLSFFDHRSQISFHRQRNKALKFQLGEDPQAYVTAKLEVLRYIDKNFSERKKVEKLMEGLPYNIQQSLVLTDIQDTNEFVSKLRKSSELHARYFPKPFSIPVQSNSGLSSIYSAPLLAQTTFADPKPNNSIQPSYNADFPSNQFHSQQSFNSQQNFVPTCRYCHAYGHDIQECRNKRSDEQRNLFQQSRPPRDPNFRRQQTSQNNRNFNQGRPISQNPYYNQPNNGQYNRFNSNNPNGPQNNQQTGRPPGTNNTGLSNPIPQPPPQNLHEFSTSADNNSSLAAPFISEN